MSKLHVDGAACFIVPAFFYRITELVRQKHSFTLAFRTFGSDAPAVISEYNNFCAGDHPLRSKFPDLPLLDGSVDGVQDRRIADGNNLASFYRSHNCVALVSDTLDMATQLKAFDGDFDAWQTAHPESTVFRNGDAIRHFREMTSRDTPAIAVRDYWKYWDDTDSWTGGKLMYVDINDKTRREVFFDDHIKPDDPDIVDFRVGSSFEELQSADKELWADHLVPVEAIHVIRDMNYFTRHLRDLKILTGED